MKVYTSHFRMERHKDSKIISKGKNYEIIMFNGQSKNLKSQIKYYSMILSEEKHKIHNFGWNFFDTEEWTIERISKFLQHPTNSVYIILHEKTITASTFDGNTLWNVVGSVRYVKKIFEHTNFKTKLEERIIKYMKNRDNLTLEFGDHEREVGYFSCELNSPIEDIIDIYITVYGIQEFFKFVPKTIKKLKLKDSSYYRSNTKVDLSVFTELDHLFIGLQYDVVDIYCHSKLKYLSAVSRITKYLDLERFPNMVATSGHSTVSYKIYKEEKIKSDPPNKNYFLVTRDFRLRYIN